MITTIKLREWKSGEARTVKEMSIEPRLMLVLTRAVRDAYQEHVRNYGGLTMSIDIDARVSYTALVDIPPLVDPKPAAKTTPQTPVPWGRKLAWMRLRARDIKTRVPVQKIVEEMQSAGLYSTKTNWFDVVGSVTTMATECGLAVYGTYRESMIGPR